MKHPFIVTVFCLSLLTLACSPKFYLVDKQTVLEDEAAGEWPEFEKQILDQTKAKGPTPFAKAENSSKKAKLYNVLNGELTTQNTTQQSSSQVTSK